MRGTILSTGRALCFALACQFAAGITVSAADYDSGFRLLKLDGYHVKWGESDIGTGATVKYAFVDAPMHFEEARNCRELVPMDRLAMSYSIPRATLQQEAAAAFGAWEDAADITFLPVVDPDQADILIGAQGQPAGHAYANVDYRHDSNENVGTIVQSLLCLNPDRPWKVGFDGNIDIYDLRYTLIHEIGHAIGLDHSGPSGQVMSFSYSEQYSELQPGDFRGVQVLYGASMKRMTAGNSSD